MPFALGRIFKSKIPIWAVFLRLEGLGEKPTSRVPRGHGAYGCPLVSAADRFAAITAVRNWARTLPAVVAEIEDVRLWRPQDLPERRLARHLSRRPAGSLEPRGLVVYPLGETKEA